MESIRLAGEQHQKNTGVRWTCVFMHGDEQVRRRTRARQGQRTGARPRLEGMEADGLWEQRSCNSASAMMLGQRTAT